MKKQCVTNYDFTIHKGEDYTGHISETVPDETLSIKTILEKFTKSGQVPSGLEHEGFDQELGPNDDPDDQPDMEKLARADDYTRREVHKAATEQKKQAAEKLSAMEKAANEKKAAKQKEIDDSVEYYKNVKTGPKGPEPTGSTTDKK